MRRKGTLLFFLLAVILVLRIGVALLGGKPVEGNDSFSYHNYAVTILQDPDWLTNPGFHGHYREPFYPLFIAAVYSVFGIKNLLAVYVFQAVLSILTCFFIYRFASRFYDERVALFALFWSGIYIFYLHYVRWLLRETLVFFLLFFLFYCLFSYLKNRSKAIWWFWGGIFVFTVLIHTDSRYIFYLPFFILLFLYYKPLKKALASYFLFAGMIVVLMVPWTIRNYIAYDGWVLVNTHTLDLRSHHVVPDKKTTTFMALTAFGKITECHTNKDYPTQEERNRIKSGIASGRSKEEVEAIRRDIYPATTFLGRKWFQFKEFWRPLRFRPAYRPCPDCRFVAWNFLHNLIFILGYGILLPFFLVGISRMFKNRDRDVWFLLFPILVHNLLHVIQWALTRYRNPIDAFIIILAGYGLITAYDQFKSKISLRKQE